MKKLILIVFLFYVYKDVVFSQTMRIYSPSQEGINYQSINNSSVQERRPPTKIYLNSTDNTSSQNQYNNYNMAARPQVKRYQTVKVVYNNKDCMDYSTEYYANKSKIVSLNQEIKYFENLKKGYSILDQNGSIQRSRIQGVINAKDYERFRTLRRNDYIDKTQAAQNE
jgi:hypothetical protein